MVEAVQRWVLQHVGSEIFRQVGQRREKWVSLDHLTGGPFGISLSDAEALRDEQREVWAGLERDARRMGGRPDRGASPAQIKGEFPLDLRGWKHESYVQGLLDQRRREDPDSLWMFDKTYDPVTAVIYPKRRHADAAATWRNGFLTVWGFPESKLHSKRNVSEYVQKVFRDIRHELQHLSQDLLREATGVSSAGGERGHASPAPEGLRFEDEHALLDVEFDTRLQDAIDTFMSDVAPRSTDLRASARVFVGDFPSGPGEAHSFFLALKRYDKKKWRRAVAEFVAQVL